MCFVRREMRPAGALFGVGQGASAARMSCCAVSPNALMFRRALEGADVMLRGFAAVSASLSRRFDAAFDGMSASAKFSFRPRAQVCVGCR